MHMLAGAMFREGRLRALVVSYYSLRERVWTDVEHEGERRHAKWPFDEQRMSSFIRLGMLNRMQVVRDHRPDSLQS